MNQEKLVYIGLGSNLGDKKNNIKQAISLIQENHKLISISSFYKSEPLGYKSNASFINAVICIGSRENVINLFKELKNIESFLGRTEKKTNQYEDRIIDLDILFFGNDIIDNELITIPHIEIPNRKFVLEPLFEIAPKLIHPTKNETIKTLLQKCRDVSKIEQITIDFS